MTPGCSGRPARTGRLINREIFDIPVIDIAATGRNIAALRKAADISVKTLQAVFGFTNPQAIYKWQNGECLPSIDNLMILSMIFDVPVNDIIVVEQG